jgi:hypothetical protein
MMGKASSTMLRLVLFVVVALIVMAVSPGIRNLIADTLIGAERVVVSHGPYSYVLGISVALMAMYALAKSAVR